MWSSVIITDTKSSWSETSGIVGLVESGADLTMQDCIFTGSINSSSSNNGCFVGYVSGSATITNCLSLGEFDYSGSTHDFRGTHSKCYVKQFPKTIPSDMQITDGQLEDGTITTDLQADHEETIWVRDPLTNQPMLALFAGKYTVPASGLGTFSAKANFTLPEGLEAYYCKDYNSSTGTISVVAIEGAVPAETGVLLRGTAGATYTLTGTNAAAATVTDNALVAVTEQTIIQQTADGYTNFGLSGGVFKKVNEAGGTVKANRAYLHIPTTAEAREISLVWDEDATAIGKEAIVKGAESTSGQWYTIGGRKLADQPTQKGIYIVNGKKVVIR